MTDTDTDTDTTKETESADTGPTGDFRLDEGQDTSQQLHRNVDPANKAETDWRLENREPTVSLTGNQPDSGVEWRAPVQELQQQQEKTKRLQRLQDKPNKTDSKPTWVSYATELGIDTHGMSKDDIIDAVENKMSDAG